MLRREHFGIGNDVMLVSSILMVASCFRARLGILKCGVLGIITPSGGGSHPYGVIEFVISTM